MQALVLLLTDHCLLLYRLRYSCSMLHAPCPLLFLVCFIKKYIMNLFDGFRGVVLVDDQVAYKVGYA